MIGVVFGILFIVSGIISLLIRNKPKFGRYMIGFRVPYTFASERAWRKAHTVTGMLFIAFGVLIAVVSSLLPLEAVVILTLVSAGVITLVGTLVAKKEFELEGFRVPDKEEEEIKPIKPLSVKPYILLSLLLILSYIAIVAYAYPLLPSSIATHFDFTGRPDRFDEKNIPFFAIPVIVMILLTLLMFVLRIPIYRPTIKLREPRKFAKEVLNLLILIEFMLLLNYVNMLWYNLRGVFIAAIPIVTVFAIFVQLARVIAVRFRMEVR